jgi:catechol 2,3-dioxygenase-like lactoylglutathione lyase family enzyme
MSGESDMSVDNVLETCLYVDDLLRAETFYSELLGLRLESRQEGRHVFFHCGRQMLLLFNPLACREPSEQFPPHGAFGPGHVAFGVREAELPAWIERLNEGGVPIEKTIDWPAGGRSVYFRDPAGNSIELATPKIWGISDDSIAKPTDH